MDNDLADRERLAAFEMRVWRRMEKISWVDKVTIKVLQKIQQSTSIF